MTATRSQRWRPLASARSHDATMQRAHPSRCHARHTSSAITPPWGTLSMLLPRMTGPRSQAQQRTRAQTTAAPEEAGRAWRRAPTPLASLPAHHWGPPRAGGGSIWTTHAWKATPAAPATTQNRRRPKTWVCGSTGSPQGSSFYWRPASDGCILRGPATSGREPAPWQTSPSAIGRGTRPPTTMDPPGQWHYVATRLMAHMGAYSPDKMNGPHWQWHQRAALRIRAAMQKHNIWDTPASPGYQGHAPGPWQPRSQDVPVPPRQAARRHSPESQRGPPPGVGSPSGTYRDPVRPFAPRRGPGSPHTSGMQGGTPEKRQGTRNPSRSRHRSRTPPPAARRVVFHEDTDRGHGGPNDLHAQRASSTTDLRRHPKRPRTKRANILTICTPAERERQAPLQTDPRRAADGACSSTATSLRGSAASSLPGGQHATEARPREPAADQRPAQGVGGQLPQPPPPPPKRGAMKPVADTCTGRPTNRARAPRGSPPKLQHGQSARARRTHRNNRSTTRAAQERTQK